MSADRRAPAVAPARLARIFGELARLFDELAAELQVRVFGVLVPGLVAAQLAPLFLELVLSMAEEAFQNEPVKAIV
jgi:hypothetical protein